jgi:NAD+ synthase (glutamine-hydrolysing)
VESEVEFCGASPWRFILMAGKQPLRITLAQLNYHTGNFELNTFKIMEQIKASRDAGSDLVVFSELCVCGYPPRDFLEFRDFINRCEDAVALIATACKGIAAIIGAPTVNPRKAGKDLYNSAYFLADGRVKEVRHKTLLPNYDIFDEYRYFEPNHDFEPVVYKGYRIALTICEDLWNINDNPMYVVNPMDMLYNYEPDLMINIAASPFSKPQLDFRREVMIDNVKKYKLPLFYVNLTGAQTQLIFDGGSMVVAGSGEVLDVLDYFTEDTRTYELGTNGEVKPVHGIVADTTSQYDPLWFIQQALMLGIREYFRKQGFSKAILGLSGGVDSALVLAIAAEALGADNVKAVLMPSRFSSQHSIDDSLAMCVNLGVPHEIISIEETFSALERTLAPSFNDTEFGITEENMQSRTRAVILMALANKFGYILLNTSNKSELAVGYGTLYGDMCGGLAVIGDLYKTEVFELCEFINRDKEIIPRNILTKPPSAELRPGQLDSDSLPPYSLLDSILYKYIEERKGPREIISEGFDEAIVERVLKLVNRAEWKRLQAPPVLRVSTKAFGFGRRVPIVARYLT